MLPSNHADCGIVAGPRGREMGRVDPGANRCRFTAVTPWRLYYRGKPTRSRTAMKRGSTRRPLNAGWTAA